LLVTFIKSVDLDFSPENSITKEKKGYHVKKKLLLISLQRQEMALKKPKMALRDRK